MSTKERITEEALTLFAEKGYKGTSVKNIADAVGIKDASLYNHFKSKQEIFDSIVTLISKHISSLSEQLGLPQYDKEKEETSELFKKLDIQNLKELSKKAFTFYLTDPYISKFWKIAHMEQYQNEQIYSMFRQIFIDNAISYQTKLFQEMIDINILKKRDARAAAINFYAPIFLLLTRYSNETDKMNDALDILDKQIEEFFYIYGH